MLRARSARCTPTARRSHVARAGESPEQAERRLVQVQKMEAIARLSGGVAHDFNTLLSVIEGQCERLLDELGHDPRGTRVKRVLQAVDKAAALTRQLLAFSRLQVLEPRTIRLDALTVDARPMLAGIAGADVELAIAVPRELGSVRADASQMIQVLVNLVANARDAMPRGGRLTIEFADVVLDERYAAGHPPCPGGRYVMMAVTDTGEGMDEITRGRVFEPFFTTRPDGVGTGLGLSTVYGIVKQSDGFVWVYSERWLGTTFKVYLPRTDAPPETAARESPLPPCAASPAQVLLVEDDEGIRELMADILRTAGHRVATAGRASEALAMADRHPQPDLLVTDVIMPGMSGPTLARALADHLPGLRVLYVSGYAGEALVRNGGIAPGERFLPKPFSERGLLQAVAAALDDRAAVARPD
jgi:two-component system, cell cycle sensor histidine kinase and response regulator CckA